MMEDTKELTTEYRMAQWAEIMRERTESGLSIVKYCEREGMPANRYYYWQRRLRSAAAEMLPAAETTVPVPAGWTQISIAENKKANRKRNNNRNREMPCRSRKSDRHGITDKSM